MRRPFSTFGYAAAKISMPLRRCTSPLRRALHRGEAANILSPKNTHTTFHFSLHMTFGCPFIFLSRFLLFLYICTPKSTSMALRKSTLAKRQRSGSTSQSAPPPPKDPHRFISWEVKRIYHESLFNRSFIPERGFPTSNAFFKFTIQNHSWQTLYAPPVPEVAPVVREFHSNLPFKMAPPSSSGASGSSLVPRPSTGSTACWMTTVRSIGRYLLTQTMSA